MNLYAHWLQEPQKDVEKLQPVHYYVMGDTVEKGAPASGWFHTPAHHLGVKRLRRVEVGGP